MRSRLNDTDEKGLKKQKCCGLTLERADVVAAERRSNVGRHLRAKSKVELIEIEREQKAAKEALKVSKRSSALVIRDELTMFEDDWARGENKLMLSDKKVFRSNGRSIHPLTCP